MENEEIIQHIMNTPDNSNPNVIRDMLRSNSGSGVSGMRGADWAAAEGEDGYIENKPFYTTPITTESIFEGEITNATSQSGLYVANLSDIQQFSDDKIIVTYDGTEYVLNKTEVSGLGSVYGDFSYNTGPTFSNYPVCIMSSTTPVQIYSIDDNYDLKIERATGGEIETTQEFQDVVSLCINKDYTIESQNQSITILNVQDVYAPLEYGQNNIYIRNFQIYPPTIFNSQSLPQELNVTYNYTTYTLSSTNATDYGDLTNFPISIRLMGMDTIAVRTKEQNYSLTITVNANQNIVNANEDFTSAVLFVANRKNNVKYGAGLGSTTEGYNTTASGEYSHAESGGTTASGQYSHAEGGGTIASGNNSHAEGGGTTASGKESHAEGGGTTASGIGSHAEGAGATASGDSSHAEGGITTASGSCSHAEGGGTTASGYKSHAEGDGTIAAGISQHVFGEYNISESSYANSVNRPNNGLVEIVGNGTYNTRSNARTLDWSGNEWLAGGLTVNGTAGVTIGESQITESVVYALSNLLTSQVGSPLICQETTVNGNNTLSVTLNELQTALFNNRQVFLQKGITVSSQYYSDYKTIEKFYYNENNNPMCRLKFNDDTTWYVASSLSDYLTEDVGESL